MNPTPDITNICPSLVTEEQEVARANLDRYIRAVLRVHERRQAGRTAPSSLDESVSGSYDPPVDANRSTGHLPPN
jgi:hypothetical protein